MNYVYNTENTKFKKYSITAKLKHPKSWPSKMFCIISVYSVFLFRSGAPSKRCSTSGDILDISFPQYKDGSDLIDIQMKT